MPYKSLQPGDKRPKKVSSDAVLKYINKHCSISVDAMITTGKLLYRGSYGQRGTYMLGRSWNNRAPMDTPQNIQATVDSFLKIEGFTALRSNSIFVSSNRRDAKAYGHIFCIFPINGFDFTWSKYHGDWQVTNQNLLTGNDALIEFTKNLEVFNQALVNGERHSALAELDRDFLINLNIASHDLLAQYNSVETLKKRIRFIIASLRRYISLMQLFPLLRVDRALLMQMATNAKNALDDKQWAKSFCEHNKMNNTDLVGAVDSSHEIYIHGSYLAVACSEEYSLINSLLR